MVEINPEYHYFLKTTFGEESNIISTDFLTYLPEEAFEMLTRKRVYPNNMNSFEKRDITAIIEKEIYF